MPSGEISTFPGGNFPSYTELIYEFLSLGIVAFGGPAMVGVIRKRIVQQKRWVNEEYFKDGVSLAQMIPGATAFQVASFCGYVVRGLPGALAAAISFILPGFLLMLALTVLYFQYGTLPWMNPILSGLRAVILGLMAWSTYTMCRALCSVKRPETIFVVLASFTGFALGLNYLVVVLGSGVLNLACKSVFPDNIGRVPALVANKGIWQQFAIVWGALSLLFGFFILLRLGGSRLGEMGYTLMKIDFLAIGGGWASLPLIEHAFVVNRHWLGQHQFIDALVLGQLTPGPIVITSTFIGYVVGGFLGATLATLAMFSPSFVMITSLSPFLQRIKHNRIIRPILAGAGLSLAGMLAHLTIKLYPAAITDYRTLGVALVALLLLLFRVQIFYIILGVMPVSYFLLR